MPLSLRGPINTHSSARTSPIPLFKHDPERKPAKMPTPATRIRPLRLGIKHGETLQIGDVTVIVSLDAARHHGRRATLVIENPAQVPVKLLGRRCEPHNAATAPTER